MLCKISHRCDETVRRRTMAIMAVLSLLSLSPLALMLPFAQRSVQPVTQRAEPTRMMFGGGKGDGGEGGFMDKLKQAQEMFNPEMMKCVGARQARAHHGVRATLIPNHLRLPSCVSQEVHAGRRARAAAAAGARAD